MGRSTKDEGAAAVEFALLLPLFVMLVFGIISGGIVFNDKLALSQGVREAARYGATLNVTGTTGGPTNGNDAYTFLNQIRTTAQGDAYGQMGSGAATYCVGFIPASGNSSAYYLTNGASSATAYTPASGTSPCGSGWPAPPTTAGIVWVLGEKPASFNLILTSYDTIMSSVAVARYEGTS